VPKRRAPVTKRQYEALANFRYRMRQFLRYSEEITRRHGLTPLQYQLMLQVKGYPGREWATISELAERLQAKHHGVVSLITRCQRAGLVKRAPSEEDRRTVHVTLTSKGAAALARLAELHRDELLAHRDQFDVSAELGSPQSPGG
jgi:DNA-binding MarR family transcriptional regulator